ncbi:hypothetical protein N7532_006685 [Penicillium argentinense]|uniref:CASTOR ACT domain-containing protein n=1 Tax=Penicillium argentinense TaxID=1131581 RepID=A0A9W9FGG9_9EURO|nr:uncharacterized protein N7532_006685 [Penicillium argentinense]KAJ5099684.1 hypothetical protein N7532_006685 [Penicillium argentinense]
MDQSLALIDAQVHFLEERLALVHIPLDLYPYFFQSVLRLIFDEITPLPGQTKEDDSGSKGNADVDFDVDATSENGSGYKPPAFLNVSITPVEVSVICPRRLVEKYFVPFRQKLGALKKSLDSQLDVSSNDYIAMQVIGEGLEAGKRVLELTSPLAMAGISIFFISTYFSDYIIVPLHSKTSVVSALESRGFQFENATASFINPVSPTSPRPERTLSDAAPPPISTPIIDESLRLVQCAAHHQFGYGSEESSMSIIRDALAIVLLVDNPRFLSLTQASLDPAASLLLEKRLLPRFAEPSGPHKDYEDGSGLLLGSKENYLVPIMLDLRDLPLEASGIVCGVAGRLADAAEVPLSSMASIKGTSKSVDLSSGTSNSSSVMGAVPALFDSFGTRLALGSNSDSEKKTSKGCHSLAPWATTHHLQPDVDVGGDAVEISFLSTARAGTIIVEEDELRRAIHALEAEKMQSSEEGPEEDAEKYAEKHTEPS